MVVELFIYSNYMKNGINTNYIKELMTHKIAQNVLNTCKYVYNSLAIIRAQFVFFFLNN